MTPGQVIAAFGEPTGGKPADSASFHYRYIAPFGSLTVPHEGYAGFEVHFVDGKVDEWHIYRLNPSFSPGLSVPREIKWYVRLLITMIVGGLVYGVIKGFQWGRSEHRQLLDMFAAREIPSRRLPPEFRFITHDTTLQEVIEKTGPCSRILNLAVDGETASGYGFIENSLGVPTITAFEYELPYHAAVIVMPEYPFGPESRVRAVFCRAPRSDDDVLSSLRD